MTPWQKRLAFGSPDLSLSLLFATVNGWFLFYLVSIQELPPLVAGTVFVFGRVLDGILDPAIGRWTDRWGRKRVIIRALPVAALGFVALWATPALIASPFLSALATATCFALFVLAYTCVAVPRLAMMPTIVPGYDARTEQAGVDMGFVCVAVLLASAGFPAAVTVLGDGGALSASPSTVWITVAGGCAILAVLAYLPFCLLIHEPARQAPRLASPGMLSTIMALRATPGALPTLARFAGSVLALVTLQSILPFWMEAGPGVAASGQAGILLCVFASMLGSMLIWVKLARRIGKVRCLNCGLGVFLAGLALAFLVPPGSGVSALLSVAAVVAGAGAGAISLCPWAMMPDVIEAHAQRLGAAVEGITTAAFTMLNKLTVAIAILLNAISLELLNRFSGWPLLILPAVCATLLLGASLASGQTARRP